MSKVILEGFIDIPESDLDAVKQELINHIELTRQEDGCIIFKVEQDPNNKSRFTVYEEFDSKEAFARHQERVKYSNWGCVTKNVKRTYNIKGV